MEEKTKQIWKAIYKIIFIFFIMPSILAFVSAIGFWVLYLSLTHPVLAEYQNQIDFQIGLLNIALGICFTQVIIILKSIDYLFGEGKEDNK